MSDKNVSAARALVAKARDRIAQKQAEDAALADAVALIEQDEAAQAEQERAAAEKKLREQYAEAVAEFCQHRDDALDGLATYVAEAKVGQSKLAQCYELQRQISLLLPDQHNDPNLPELPQTPKQVMYAEKGTDHDRFVGIVEFT
jgi:hypothetical protein